MSNSIHARALIIEDLIRAGNNEQALKLIHTIVETIITEPICTSQVYASPRLDALAQEIGKNIFVNSTGSTVNATDAVPTYVYLTTKLQNSGGHTRLLRDFIFARPTARHIILVTGLAGRSADAWLKETFADIKDCKCMHAPRGGYVATVRWLQAQLQHYAPEHTYLFNHHEDVTIVAAMVPELHLAASFCHHGDHHLTLGMHLPHVTHLDFHPTSFHRCRDLGIANRYISFTVPPGIARDDATNVANSKLITCTAARKNKVETPYPIRYTQVIPAVLAATGGTHIHIGTLSRKGLAAIAKGMKVQGIPAERFVYIPWVQNIREVLLEKHVDLYLASFPLGGGLTTVEVMSTGIPIAVHKHMTVRELGGLDIVYPSAFLWRKVSELIDYLAHVTASDLQKQSADARAHYMRNYTRSLRTMLENPLSEAPALTMEFTPAQDEWALWAAQHITIGHILHRCAYRRYRQLSRWTTRVRFV